MLNILIFPSGSGVAKEIYDSLKYIRNITLFGGEGNDNNFTNFLFNNAIFNIPMLKDRVKIIEQDNLWRQICHINNWEAIPTV